MFSSGYQCRCDKMLLLQCGRILSSNLIRATVQKPTAVYPLVKWGNQQRYYYDQKRGYKNFGHKPDPVSKFTNAWHGLLGLMIVGCCINYKGYFSLVIFVQNLLLIEVFICSLAKMIFPPVDADSGVRINKNDDIKSDEKLESEEISEAEEESSDETETQGKKKNRREKIGFRDRKVIRILNGFSLNFKNNH